MSFFTRQENGYNIMTSLVDEMASADPEISARIPYSYVLQKSYFRWTGISNGCLTGIL